MTGIACQDVGWEVYFHVQFSHSGPCHAGYAYSGVQHRQLQH